MGQITTHGGCGKELVATPREKAQGKAYYPKIRSREREIGLVQPCRKAPEKECLRDTQGSFSPFYKARKLSAEEEAGCRYAVARG